MLGIGLLVQEAYLGAGLTFGLGSLMHAHVMMLAFPVAVAYLATEREGRISEIFRLLVPIVFLALPWIYIIFTSYMQIGAGQEESTYWKIASDFRNPHHTHAWDWCVWSNGEIRRYVGVLLLQASALAACPPDPLRRRKVIVILAPIASMVAISTFATIMFHSSWLGRFEVWKLSPFLTLIGWAFLGGTGAALMSFDRLNISRDKLIASCIMAALGLIVLGTHWRHSLLVALFAASLLGARVVLTLFAVPVTIRRSFHMLSIVVLVLISFLSAWSGLQRSDMAVHRLDDSHSLVEWVRENTPRRSLFLVPFDLNTFRLCALRSAVVEFKAFPFDKRGIVEWYRRVTEISGAPPRSMKEALRSYNGLNAERIRELRSLWGIDYVITYSGKHWGDTTGLPLAYEDRYFRVFAVGSHRTPTGAKSALHRN